MNSEIPLRRTSAKRAGRSARAGVTRVCSGVWLIVGWPIFGLMPLVYGVLGWRMNHEVVYLWMEALDDLLFLFITNPDPSADHVAPPLTTLGWVVMVMIANVITVPTLWYLRKELVQDS